MLYALLGSFKTTKALHGFHYGSYWDVYYHCHIVCSNMVFVFQELLTYQINNLTKYLFVRGRGADAGKYQTLNKTNTPMAFV